MKTLFLSLLLLTAPVHAWTICMTGEPETCMTETELNSEDPTAEEIAAWDAEQAAIDEIILIFNTQRWNEDYPLAE